jgi:hypothetical protein
MLEMEYQMENQNVVINTGGDEFSQVVTARRALVGGLRNTGKFISDYAQSLETAFNVTNTDGSVTMWYDLKGKQKAGLKAEREAFKAEILEAGYDKGTVDVYWQRTKQASGYIPTGNRVTGNETTDTKNKADLMTIINRIFKAEESGEECESLEHKRTLMDIYESLGGDMDKLG